MRCGGPSARPLSREATREGAASEMRGYDFQGSAFARAAAHAVWSLHFFITSVALLMPGSSTADLQANNIGKAFQN